MHPKNAKKFTKNLFLRGSRSFKVIDVDKSKKPVTGRTDRQTDRQTDGQTPR